MIWSSLTTFFDAHPILSAILRIALLTIILGPYMMRLGKVKDHD